MSAFATRPRGGALATRGLAAHLSWKQAELLLILEDGPKTVHEIGEVMRELYDRDMIRGRTPMYWGVDDQAARACAKGLERRGLVEECNGVWSLTPAGREAAGMVR